MIDPKTPKFVENLKSTTFGELSVPNQKDFGDLIEFCDLVNTKLSGTMTGLSIAGDGTLSVNADAGDVDDVYIDNNNKLVLKTTSAGGLTTSTLGLAIVRAPNSGLDLSSTAGLRLTVEPDKGFETLSATSPKLTLRTGPGIVCDPATGLQIKRVDNTSGLTTTKGLSILCDPTGGLTIDPTKGFLTLNPSILD